MYRLEYQIDEEDEDEVRKESIVVDKRFITLADDVNVDIALDSGTPGRYTIEEAKVGTVTLRETEPTGLLKVNGQSVHATELRDEDVVAIGEVEFTYFHITPPVAIVTRSSSLMQHISSVAVGILLIGQIVFLVWVLLFWRMGHSPLAAAEAAQEAAKVAEVARANPVPPQESPTKPSKPKPAPAPSAEVIQPAPAPKPAPTVVAKVAPEVAAPEPAKVPPPVVGQPVDPTPVPTVVHPEVAVVPPVVAPTPPPAVATPETRPHSPRPVLPEIASETIPEKPAIESPESMLLKSAHEQIEKGNLIRADDYFKMLQRSNPTYLPVYSDRARLFEKRGMLQEAIDQWQQLSQQSTQDTIWSNLAQKEINRLAERLHALQAATSIQSQSVTAPPALATAPPSRVTAMELKVEPPPNVQMIEIITAEAPQMGSGDNYDYMRILSVEIMALPAGDNLRGEDVRVKVQFYDQDRTTRRIYPSEIYIPKTEFHLTGLLPAGKVHSITCPYTVPLNYRDKQYQSSKRSLIYYGFTVEVYYKGILQHYKAKPLSLSSRIER